MRPHVVLEANIDSEDWTYSFVFAQHGVLQGFVTLKLGDHVVLDYSVHGLNNSIVSLLRSTVQDHQAATSKAEGDCEWPLFFCNGALRNQCGVISDFSVRRRGDKVVFSDFLRCECGPGTVIEVLWIAWAEAVEKLATSVLRHLPSEKKGVRGKYRPTYRRSRREAKRLLLRLREALRSV